MLLLPSAAPSKLRAQGGYAGHRRRAPAPALGTSVVWASLPLVTHSSRPVLGPGVRVSPLTGHLQLLSSSWMPVSLSFLC